MPEPRGSRGGVHTRRGRRSKSFRELLDLYRLEVEAVAFTVGLRERPLFGR